MSVSHAAVSTVTSADEEPSDELPGLLQVLAQVPDPRRRGGKRYLLVFVLAVAVACTLAGARNFREIGDHAADLPQGLLGRLGGRPHPLLRQIIAPSEKRIRTLLQQIDAAKLDEVTGCWLRSLAGAGRLDGLLRAIAIDGKWLRGIGDGQAGEAVRRDAAPGKGGHRPARDPRGHQRDHPGQATAGPGGPGRRGGHRGTPPTPSGRPPPTWPGRKTKAAGARITSCSVKGLAFAGPATWPASLTASRRTGSRRRPGEARTNQPSHGFLVPGQVSGRPGLGCEMAPDGRKPVPVPGRPLVTVLVHYPALPDDRERLDTAAATQLRPSTCAGSRPAQRHAGLATT